MKNFRRLSALLALLMLAAMVFAVIGCGGNNGDQNANVPEATLEPTEEPTPEPTEEPTPEPTEEPTPEPTEAAFVPETVDDYSIFDKPLSDLCALVLEPDYEKFKTVYPSDFFDGLKNMLDEALEEAGMSYADLGYEDFDDYLLDNMGDTFSPDFFEDEEIGEVERIEYNVTHAETADVNLIKDALEPVFGQYLDMNKITEAYKIDVDLTAYGTEGESDADTADGMYIYEYDGEYFILFA